MRALTPQERANLLLTEERAYRADRSRTITAGTKALGRYLASDTPEQADRWMRCMADLGAKLRRAG